MATDDFTFPIIFDASPRFLDSPPLWRSASSSAAATTTNTSGPEEDDCCSESEPADHRLTKSFSGAERGRGGDGSEDDDDGEDRMDMLWEDFNEELHDRCSSMSGSEETAAKVGCVPAIGASTTGGAVVAARRAASLLMFMKMLKKLFQIHHSHPSHKAHSL